MHGDYYFIFFVDYFTRITWVSFLERKLEAFHKFREFKELVENEISILNSYDTTMEEKSPFISFYEEHGIKI